MTASNGRFFLFTIFFSMLTALLAHPSNKNQLEKRQGYNIPGVMGGAGKGPGGMMGGGNAGGGGLGGPMGMPGLDGLQGVGAEALQKNGGGGDGCKKYKIIR
ncbi:hypothetical protein CROQUDRAFT_132083 [Cronartium quercuum f. sp. fusiforme G11]|uniref:Glycine-rich protein n=1 Tax=Cronartium quercuum f. sp. fusiforme G11 TaxID=708437 RepID=A0A9P6NJB6_9BASI|nr:hypothetical protein CROQUDRAFT_132083 [Cronartium quercuum f. sp. fusiforme G11]